MAPAHFPEKEDDDVPVQLQAQAIAVLVANQLPLGRAKALCELRLSKPESVTCLENSALVIGGWCLPHDYVSRRS